MILLKSINEPRTRKNVPPIVTLPKVRQVNHTSFRDGLVTSMTVTEVYEDTDLHQDFRDYSLRTLIQLEAIDLLKEVGSIPVSPLTASDSASRVSVSISDFRSRLDELKERLNVTNNEQSKTE